MIVCLIIKFIKKLIILLLDFCIKTILVNFAKYKRKRIKSQST